MTRLDEWVRLPNGWIEKGGLRKFRWDRGRGADNIAALMVLAIIAHHMRPDDGVARITYDDLTQMASLSRDKVSKGLSVLVELSILEREPEGRSTYKINNYNPNQAWAMFPANGMYRNNVVTAFADFRLRQPAELESLKLFFLFASRRDRRTNTANISYQKIEEMSGIASQKIKRGLAILAANSLVYVEQIQSKLSEHGVSNVYRLAHINPRQHQGTTGRLRERSEYDFDMES